MERSTYRINPSCVNRKCWTPRALRPRQPSEIRHRLFARRVPSIGLAMKQRNRPRIPHRQPGRSKPAGSDPDGTIWLYGLHAAAAALANPARRIERVLATANAAHALEAVLARAGTAPEIAGAEAVAAMLPPGAVHQGIAVAARPLPARDLDDLCAGLADRPAALLIALDQVGDPQNVGAILRSAAAFGADGLIVTQRHAPSVSGALAKAASGALEHVPLVAVVNLARTLDTLGDEGFLRVGLSGDGSTALSAVPEADRLILVLGAEATGLRRLTRERCDVLTRLPTTPVMPSLNVSAAAAVALYEIRRGR
jgi:23S rRNA (guanosine2251-2'-O)-methyltransferase